MKRIIASITLGWILTAVAATPVLANKSGHPVHEPGDPIEEWIKYPERRDPSSHLAFVEIQRVSDEEYSYKNDPKTGQVSFDGMKTWSSLRRVRTGWATVKVIKSPDGGMPSTVTVHFEISHYIRTRDEQWTDDRVRPGKRLLGIFKGNIKGQWDLYLDCFYDPLTYFVSPKEQAAFEAFFGMPLADEASIREFRAKLREAARRSRRDAK